MKTIILLPHIILAIVSLSYASGVVIATRKRNMPQAKNRVKRMWQTTIAVMLSGIGLSIVSKAPLGRSCLSLLSVLGLVLAAHFYERTVREKTGCPYLDSL